MVHKELEEGGVVLCTVEKISGTTVFLKIDNDGEGTMITSEVAPGRIRNLRDYVIPNKKVVCKILRIDEHKNIHLSLRRVSAKEKKEILEREEKEKNFKSILKTVVKEKANEIFVKIKEEQDIALLFEDADKLPELLRYLKKEDAERVSEILKERKEKEVFIKKEFSLLCKKQCGIDDIKKVLLPYSENISYLAAGHFSIKVVSTDYKKANTLMSDILQNIEKKAKEEKMEFEVKEK